MTTKKRKLHKLPGDITSDEFVKQVIRVDHAGEYGAKRIYEGQMAVLKKSPVYKTIAHMAKQEEEHLKYFSEEISNRKVRPTALMPIWHVGAFAMGAVTAMMGEKAAMACTVAVEEVIDEHYQEQLLQLGEGEADLKNKIAKFRDEELEHRDIGLENNAENAPAYPLLRFAVRGATKMAIALSKKV
ncbi:MAG: ubiquinone biosynthesis protein UbiB [Rickettsiaceae bacterium]|jgi:ubiquinone biosynthesis monooxygenase Coq7|nr:ubiquinone biosynthesis protein UbiB [Rickettsiaceae bacterium]